MLTKILKKKGFTLVEILVVLAIIALLSTLAVNGYLSYRKNTLLDLAADNLISQIQEMRGKTMHGDGNFEKFEEIKAKLENGGGGDVDGADSLIVEPKCYGVYFQNSLDGFTVKSLIQNFVNKKIWDSVIQKWHYKGCVDFEESQAGDFLEKDQQIKIFGISDKAGISLNSFVLRFVPPNGSVEMSKNTEQFAVVSEGDLLKIKIQYGSDADLNYQREIVFDLFNNAATVNKLN